MEMTAKWHYAGVVEAPLRCNLQKLPMHAHARASFMLRAAASFNHRESRHSSSRNVNFAISNNAARCSTIVRVHSPTEKAINVPVKAVMAVGNATFAVPHCLARQRAPAHFIEGDGIADLARLSSCRRRVARAAGEE